MIAEGIALAIGLAAGLWLRRGRRRAHAPRALLLAEAVPLQWRWKDAYEAGEVTLHGACAWCAAPSSAFDQPPPCGGALHCRLPPPTPLPGPGVLRS